jgi:hypothetical protein
MILELSCAKMGLWFVGSAFVSFIAGILVPSKREICADVFALSMYLIFIFIVLSLVLSLFDSSISFVG